jgi:hypothetical protein
MRPSHTDIWSVDGGRLWVKTHRQPPSDRASHLPQKPESKGLAPRLDTLWNPAALRRSSDPGQPST